MGSVVASAGPAREAHAGAVIGSNVASLFPFEENLSGSLRNFSAQLFAQKYQSFPPQLTVAAARAGSTFMPQTGSIAFVTAVGVCGSIASGFNHLRRSAIFPE